MFIIYIFLGMIVFNFIRLPIKFLRQCYKEVIQEEANEKRRLDANRERDRVQRAELQKQLEAIQYQIRLLDALDGVRSGDMSDEKEIKKALQLEKQYNALWMKERKLKSALKELGE